MLQNRPSVVGPTSWKRSDPSPPAHVDRSLGDLTPREAAAAYGNAVETTSTLWESGEAVYPETASAYADCLERLAEVTERDGRGMIHRP